MCNNNIILTKNRENDKRGYEAFKFSYRLLFLVIEIQCQSERLGFTSS